jgi:hypothetical protein
MSNDTIRIPLSQKGKKYKGLYETVIDTEDKDLAALPWSVFMRSDKLTVYAYRKENEQNVLMHRVILARKLERESLLPHEEVDHIDGDGKNNTRENLRLANTNQNKHNRGKSSNNSSGYKGVSWHKDNKHWRATIGIAGKAIHIGSYPTAEEADKAACEAREKYHQDFANHGKDNE